MATDIPGIQKNVRWCLAHLTGPSGDALSYPGFAQYTAEHELPGSEGSLRQLDSGWRHAPGAALLASISSYFAIPVDFWTNEQVREAVRRLDVDGHRGRTLSLIERMLELAPAQQGQLEDPLSQSR